MIGLVSPFAGIHNLDMSPDSLSADGAHQIWGQLTPHDDSSYDSASLPSAGTYLIRAYQSEVEMYGQKKGIQSRDQILTGQLASTHTIFTFIHICLCYRLQWRRSMKTSQR
jgi:hypothetical protein